VGSAERIKRAAARGLASIGLTSSRDPFSNSDATHASGYFRENLGDFQLSGSKQNPSGGTQDGYCSGSGMISLTERPSRFIFSKNRETKQTYAAVENEDENEDEDDNLPTTVYGSPGHGYWLDSGRR